MSKENEQFNAIFAELFGGSTGVRSSLGDPQNFDPVPDLPTDDAFSKAARTAQVDRLLDAGFVSELVGDVTDAAGLVFTPTSQKTINQKAASFPDDFMEQILPTSEVLGSWAPRAEAAFADLIKPTPRKKWKQVQPAEPMCWTCMQVNSECKCSR
jgi:hypothetical protein